MARVIAITDEAGKLLGAVRTNPIKTDQGTLRFVQTKHAKHIQQYHELDVSDQLLTGSVDDLHDELQSKVRG
jgi:hypothetical protein